MSFAFISGTGLYDFGILNDAKEETIKTPYGEAVLYHANYHDQNIYFLPRHGKKHSVAPHQINYRANIAAIKLLGISEVLAFCSVGSMDKEIRPGSLVFLRQFIDMTWGREQTFVMEGMVNHVTMDEPYCPRLTGHLLDIAAENNIPLRDDGVYLCTQGPRFETPAEIGAFASWGANLVGMTGVPEVVLAREAGLCYASLAVVANYAAGLSGKINAKEIEKETEKQKKHLEKLLECYLNDKATAKNCVCRDSEVLAFTNWSL